VPEAIAGENPILAKEPWIFSKEPTVLVWATHTFTHNHTHTYTVYLRV